MRNVKDFRYVDMYFDYDVSPRTQRLRECGVKTLDIRSVVETRTRIKWNISNCLHN